MTRLVASAVVTISKNSHNIMKLASQVSIVILISVISSLTAGQECQSDDGSGECSDVVDEKCPHRGHIIKCAGLYLDTNSKST